MSQVGTEVALTSLESNCRLQTQQLTATRNGQIFLSTRGSLTAKMVLPAQLSRNLRVPLHWRSSLHRFTWAAVGGFVFFVGTAVAQEPPNWKVGTAFTTQLKETVDVDWRDRTLRGGLVNLSQTYGVVTFLDRRIDPDRPITASIHDQPLDKWLELIAHAAQAEISLIGPVVYVGPPEAVKELATLAALRRQDATKRNVAAKARLLKAAAWQWNELAQPRELLRELGQQAEVKFENPELVPLDVWPKVQLPPLPWVDRATLLLFGFGLTYEFNSDGTAARLIPIPSSLVLEKRYNPRGGATELAAQLRRVMPEAQIRVEQSQLIVAARQEDHDKIDRLLTGQSVTIPKPAKGGGEKLYSIQVPNQPAGNVIQTIANKLGKQPRFSPAVAEKLRKPVEFEVKDVTLGLLLEKTLKPLGLTFRLSENVLEVIENP